MSLSHRLPPERLGSPHVPERDKAYIEIRTLERSRRSAVEVKLSLLLDEDDPAHVELERGSGHSALRVVYVVPDVDLQAERRLLWRRLHESYESNLGAKLRRTDDVAALTDIELRELLAPLAAQGDALRERLFGFPDDLQLDTGRPRAWDAPIRAVLRDYFLRPRLIHVVSDAPLFPWAFLYQHANRLDNLDLRTLHPDGFWGMRHEIQHEVPEVATALRLPSRPRIVAAICPSLDAASHYSCEHPLGVGGTLQVVADAPALRRRLADFHEDCLYFFGHAHHDDVPLPTTSWLRLDGLELSVSTLVQGDAPNFRSEPVLVFLNGCGSGHLTDWDANTVIGHLAHRGDHRVCCVTVAAEVPAGLAREFARRFWRRFLDARAHLGAAVLGARLELLREHNNPLGLLYEVIGKIDTRIHEAV